MILPLFSPYAPINRNTVGVGSVVIAAQLAAVPSLVKYFPVAPDCDGTTYTDVVSNDTVTVPDVPPPLKPVPAVTPKISPLPIQADPSYD
jgi:hypothetical protein